MRVLRPETKALRSLISQSGITRKQIADRLKTIDDKVTENTVDNLLTDRRSLDTGFLREILDLIGVSMARYGYIADLFRSVQQSRQHPGPLTSEELAVAEILNQSRRRHDPSAPLPDVDPETQSGHLRDTLLHAFDMASGLTHSLKARTKER